jgi:NAD(P)H-dependent FMN reductase
MWRNGRRNGLKIRWAIKGPCRFESGHRQLFDTDFCRVLAIYRSCGFRIDSRSPDRLACWPSRLSEGVPALRVADYGAPNCRLKTPYRKTIHELRITNYDPEMERPLFIPIILGTARQGRRSEHAARFIFEQTKKRADVETELIDVRKLPMRLDDAGEQMKDPTFSATIERCDGLIIVTPEYNHGYPGLLKHALDMNLKEYIHKAVGVCGVSAGPFGGARVIEALLPVTRELGLVTIFEDVNFGKVQEIFDEPGRLLDQSYVGRVDKFLNELIWMARVLRHGRENVALV